MALQLMYTHIPKPAAGGLDKPYDETLQPKIDVGHEMQDPREPQERIQDDCSVIDLFCQRLHSARGFSLYRHEPH